ncbi:MAG: hypothetical protein RQ745_06655 [Longimicrobiales bacterium]|nr:hypothetical protein [Longimicrobiales bacterium]
MTPLLYSLIALNVALLVVGWRMHRRMRRERRERRVEAPNSAYTSPHVRDIEAKERWLALDLNRLHPLNRSEAVRLLRRLEGASARALDAHERTFLDRLVEAEQRSAARGSRTSGTKAKEVPGRVGTRSFAG